MHEDIIVVSGSSPLPRRLADSIPEAAIVIAVDGGLDHALAAGLTPSGLIGDLDSVSAEGLAWADVHATISRHPADKDLTDTELALDFVADMNPARLTLLGGGERLDHTFAAIGALGRSTLTSIPRIDAWWNEQHINIIHGPGTLDLDAVTGSTLSLLALHGPCAGVSISGVRWPLDDVELPAVAGWGVSNEVTDDLVSVRLSTGVLAVFDVPDSP